MYKDVSISVAFKLQIHISTLKEIKLMIMRHLSSIFILLSLISVSTVLAQDAVQNAVQDVVRETVTPQSVARDGITPSCTALVHAWEDATADAQTYKSVINVVRANGNELMYQEADHFKNPDDGEWIREVTFERSFLPFPMGGRPESEDGEEDSAEEFCEGASVEAQGNRWLVRLALDEDSPMTNSTMLYEPQGDRYVITDMSGDFDVKILAFKFKGTFMSSFGDWVFAPTGR